MARISARLYMLVLAALLVAVSSSARESSAATTPDAGKPNIIFILADDLAWNLVQYMPNVQAMQHDGITFSNYFVTDSLCCPSRSSIFTGKLPHDTQVFTNMPPLGGYEAFNAHGNEAQTFAVALQGDGYRTAMLGKYLNGYQPDRDNTRQGWNEWDVAGNGYPEFHYALNQNGRVVQYGNDPKDYLTDVASNIADAFVRHTSPGPFFIEIATFAPHAPYIPAPRDADKFPGLEAPRGPAFGARPGPAAPQWLKDIPPLSPAEIANIDKAFRMRAQAVQAVDQMIGRLRATIAALGIQNNTYVIFSSDNGYHMGEYSLRPGKMTAYETDIRVPLIIVGPVVASGVSVDAIVENIDLAPTFTAWGGGPGGTNPDGHSLIPLLGGKLVADWRRVALVEHRHPGYNASDPDAPPRHSANPPSYEAVRTAEGTYVEYQTGEATYYNLMQDPNELRNFISSLPAAKRQRLHEILAANSSCRGAVQCWQAQSMTP